MRAFSDDGFSCCHRSRRGQQYAVCFWLSRVPHITIQQYDLQTGATRSRRSVQCLPNNPLRWRVPRVFFLEIESVVRLLFVRRDQRSEAQHGLGALDGLARPGQPHPVLDQRPARSLDDVARDWQFRPQCCGVVQCRLRACRYSVQSSTTCRRAAVISRRFAACHWPATTSTTERVGSFPAHVRTRRSAAARVPPWIAVAVHHR